LIQSTTVLDPTVGHLALTAWAASTKQTWSWVVQHYTVGTGHTS